MTINKKIIQDIIVEAAQAQYANDYFALQGLLDFLLMEVQIPLDRLQRSAEKLYGIPAGVFYNTVEQLGFHEYRN